jgi:succinate dehydrogenase hydrophobic anchor subunit
VLAIFGLLPFWEEPIMPETTRAMVAAMNVVSLVFLGAWFVNNMLLVPARLRALRRRASPTAR